MKIAITGHTKGIGAALFKKLQKQGHDVVGFSRTNGWDFIDKDTITDFVESIENNSFDCFINNAYPHKFYQHWEGFVQIELLNQVWLKWEKDSTKTIVVLGSHNADNAKAYYYPLGIHKKALDETCKQLRNTRPYPHIINVKPSYVDTQVIGHLNNVLKTDPNDVADIIIWALNHKLKIYDISFGEKG